MVPDPSFLFPGSRKDSSLALVSLLAYSIGWLARAPGQMLWDRAIYPTHIPKHLPQVDQSADKKKEVVAE